MDDRSSKRASFEQLTLRLNRRVRMNIEYSRLGFLTAVIQSQAQATPVKFDHRESPHLTDGCAIEGARAVCVND